MITEIAVLEDPSALRTWFPALSGRSGNPWHHLPFTSLRLQGSAKAYEPSPLFPISEYFHSVHLCLDTECLDTVAGDVFSAHTDVLPTHMSGGSVLPLVWTAWPRRKMNSNCNMSFRRWMEVRGSMVLWAVFQSFAHQLHDIAAFVSQCLQTEWNQGCKPENQIHVLCWLMTDSRKR